MGGMTAHTLSLVESSWHFLRARWERLCLFNYSVEPALLQRHLPPGLELDLLDGLAHVSLVAFDFRDTRVLGVPWPGFRNFPEINLRFYVREGDQRGVAFIRELVPSAFVAWMARMLYNEPYLAVPMRSDYHLDETKLEVRHHVRLGGVEQTIVVSAAAGTEEPGVDEEAEFFKEHSWGYGTSRRGRLVRYEVCHPPWRTHVVQSYDLAWDFAQVYGEKWGFLSRETPRSVSLAEGSAILVSPRLG
jgi:uncharacterized protein YqjF (DUF2071 family)